MSVDARPLPGAVLLAGAGVLWGGAGAAGRMLANAGSLSSLHVAGGRALIGGLVLASAALAWRRPWPRGSAAWRHVAVMAVLTVLYQTCYFAAVAAGALSLATLVTLGSAPVFVTVVHAWRHRRLEARSVGVLALALVGLGLLVGRPDAAGSALLVSGLSLVAGAVFAAITLVNEHPVPGGDPISSTGVAFLIAGMAMVIALAVLPGPAVALSGGVVLWLGVLGIACTAAPYALYFTGLLRASAPMAALFALLEPLTGTLIAVAGFGERLGVSGWLGAALLFASVLAASTEGGVRR